MHIDGRVDALVQDGLGPVHDRDQLERAFRRISVDHRASSCSTSISTCRSPMSPRRSASRSARSSRA
jgi:hypothetical protein